MSTRSFIVQELDEDRRILREGRRQTTSVDGLMAMGRGEADCAVVRMESVLTGRVIEVSTADGRWKEQWA